jgi:hypothetical protein
MFLAEENTQCFFKPISPLRANHSNARTCRAVLEHHTLADLEMSLMLLDD